MGIGNKISSGILRNDRITLGQLIADSAGWDNLNFKQESVNI